MGSVHGPLPLRNPLLSSLLGRRKICAVFSRNRITVLALKKYFTAARLGFAAHAREGLTGSHVTTALPSGNASKAGHRDAVSLQSGVFASRRAAAHSANASEPLYHGDYARIHGLLLYAVVEDFIGQLGLGRGATIWQLVRSLQQLGTCTALHHSTEN